MRNIITSALLLVLSFQYIEGSAQVTKSNNTQGVYNGSSDMKTLNFGAADFGANPTIDKVTVLIEFSSQDNGTFGLTFHEDIAFRLESPMGTTVDLVYDVRGFFTGNASQQVTYGGFDPTSTVQVTFDDSAAQSVLSSPNGNPTTGIYTPIESLSVFNNESPIGNWTLHIADSFDNGFDDQLFFLFASIAITTPTLSVIEYETKKITVFPTLVKDFIEIKKIDKINELSLFSISGKKIKDIVPNSKNRYDLSQLASGIYFLRINTDSGLKSKKIIKK